MQVGSDAAPALFGSAYDSMRQSGVALLNMGGTADSDYSSQVQFALGAFLFARFKEEEHVYFKKTMARQKSDRDNNKL